MAVKVSFIGRLGANADVVTSQSTPFISLRAAVNDRVNKKDETTWLTVTADYNRYKNMVQYLTQGTVVSVYGTERCSTYPTKNGGVGIDRKVNADSIEFVNLGRKQDGDSVNASNNAMTTGSLHSATQAQAAVAAASSKPAAVNATPDDDLPF